MVKMPSAKAVSVPPRPVAVSGASAPPPAARAKLRGDHVSFCSSEASRSLGGGPRSESQRPAPSASGALVSAAPSASELPAGARRRAFATHAERRAFDARAAVEALLAELPPAVAGWALGKDAAAQVPSAARRKALLVKKFLAKAGPDGAEAKNMLRVWRLHKAAAQRAQLPDDALPATAAFCADVVEREQARATAEAAGSQGGATVGMTIRRGYRKLRSVACLPVDADDALVEAAAAPEGALPSAPTRHAGVYPVALQCQFEHCAGATEDSVLRFVARSFLVGTLAHHVRAVDALNAHLWPDERQPGRVIRGSTRVRGKRGALPIQLYAVAEGFLGEWAWFEEHLAAVRQRGHVLPDFESAPRLKGRPSASPGLLPGVMRERDVLPAMRDIASQAPLCMAAAEFDALQLTGHSPHTTGCDMVRFAGERAGFSMPADARAIGHWLRDRNAQQPDPRRVRGAPTRGQPDGAPCSRGDMALRYSQGGVRRGEREEQLDVRGRLVALVRRGLVLWGKGWQTLPRGTEDWEILRAVWELGERPLPARCDND